MARRNIRSRLREMRIEVLARRAGRRAYKSNQFRPIRHIIGPTGWLAQHSIEPAAKGAEAFNRSFEPKIPPSIHISHRDATRFNQPMPLAERCIEDWRFEVKYLDPHAELDLD